LIVYFLIVIGLSALVALRMPGQGGRAGKRAPEDG
jgi:hypothetical protein